MCSSGHKAGHFIRIRRSLCCLQLKIVKGKQRKDLPMPSSLNWRKTISTVRNSILSPQYSCPEEEKESSVITQTTEQDMWPSFSSSPLDAGPEKETVPKAYLKSAFLPAPCWLPGAGKSISLLLSSLEAAKETLFIVFLIFCLKNGECINSQAGASCFFQTPYVSTVSTPTMNSFVLIVCTAYP